MATNIPQRESETQRTTGQTQTEQAQQKAGEVADKAREKTREVAEQAGQQAKSAVAEQKGKAASELSSVAQALRNTSNQLRQQDQSTFAQYGNELASKVDHLSTYLEDHSVDELLADAEDAARRRPELFLGGAFTLGLVVARFLKSSERSSYSMTRTDVPGAAYSDYTYRQGEGYTHRPYGETTPGTMPERRTYGTGGS